MRNCQKSGLDLADHSFYAFWRSNPKDETIPRVYIVWIRLRIEKLREDGIYAETCKVKGKQLGFLLLVSLLSMRSIARLYLSLSKIRQSCESTVSQILNYRAMVACI